MQNRSKEVLGSVLSERDHKVVMSAMQILEKALEKTGDIFKSPELTRSYLVCKVAHLEHEEFGALWLDNRNRLIAPEELSKGTIDGAVIHCREVVKSALFHGAAACILYHNHPSQVGEASQADRRITDRLKNALDLIDVRMLDHVIVCGPDEYVSFAESGWI